MRTAADSVTAADLPPGLPVYLAYRDGAYVNYDEVRSAHPSATVVGVTVFPGDNEGDMLDVENGDATPAQAPGWVNRRRQAGHGGPLVYFSEAIRAEVVTAFQSASVPLPGLFVAAYPGVGPALQQPGDVGHQYEDTGPYDLSVVVDYLPGIDPAPIPPSPPKEDENMTSQIIAEGTPNAQVHVWWTNPSTGVCTHWWQKVGGNPPPGPSWDKEVLP